MEELLEDEYKNTKLGLIPSEWEVIKLNKVCHKIMVGIASSATHAYSNEGIPMFRNQNIKEGGLDDSDLLYINENYERVHKNKRLKENDILTIRTGYPGLSCVVPLKYENAQCFTSLIIRPIQEIINSNWLVYFINSPIGKKIMKALEAGGAQKNINSGSLEKLTIPLIDLKEQQKIAQILSQWDEAIETTQTLIEKLQLRKKGLMQELLSGKKRLAGFSEEWKMTELKPHLIKHSEVSTESSQYPVLTSSRRGIFFQTDYYTREVASKDNTGYNVVPRGYFTYRHMSDDLIFKFNINTLCDKGIVSTLYPVFTTKETLEKEYLLNVLNEGEEFKRYALKQKQGGSRTYMYFGKLEKLRIPLPKIEEQRAIINFINTLQSEIDEYNNLLRTQEEQKKGLMQQLLTGKKRVKL